jgi:regulator of sigma E protease
LFSWKSRDGEVEFVVAAIPLGGYVKMLGEQGSETQLSEADKKRAFDMQPVWKRASIAVAGPAFNFFFAIVAYMVVAWLGQQVIPPVIGSVYPASVAEQAGLLVGDQVKSINGRAVHSWREVEESLRDNIGSRVSLTLLRDNADLTVEVLLPETESEPLLSDVSAESLGIGPGIRVKIASVVPESPADRAGLKMGDAILQVEGKPVDNVRGLIREIRKNAGKQVVLSIQRDGKALNVTVTPEDAGESQGRIGAQLAAEPLQQPVLYRMGVIDGIMYGFTRTYDMTVLTLEMFGKMLVAAISPQNLGGPIAIAQLAGKTAALGLVAFLSFLALVSVNLGVINLLPVPVLDGGQLAYLGVEKILGRPLSPKVMEKTQIVGIALLVTLMLFAFYNDLLRLFKG